MSWMKVYSGGGGDGVVLMTEEWNLINDDL